MISSSAIAPRRPSLTIDGSSMAKANDESAREYCFEIEKMQRGNWSQLPSAKGDPSVLWATVQMREAMTAADLLGEIADEGVVVYGAEPRMSQSACAFLLSETTRPRASGMKSRLGSRSARRHAETRGGVGHAPDRKRIRKHHELLQALLCFLFLFLGTLWVSRSLRHDWAEATTQHCQ